MWASSITMCVCHSDRDPSRRSDAVMDSTGPVTLLHGSPSPGSFLWSRIHSIAESLLGHVSLIKKNPVPCWGPPVGTSSLFSAAWELPSAPAHLLGEAAGALAHCFPPRLRDACHHFIPHELGILAWLVEVDESKNAISLPSPSGNWRAVDLIQSTPLILRNEKLSPKEEQ